LLRVGARGSNLLADSAIENVNRTVNVALKETRLELILAQVEVAWSNSTIEIWWRKIKDDWKLIHRLDTLATVETLVAFYVEQCNSAIPQWQLRVVHVGETRMPSRSLRADLGASRYLTQRSSVFPAPRTRNPVSPMAHYCRFASW